MDEKELEKLFEKFMDAIKEGKTSKEFEDDLEDLKEEEFEESKKQIKKELIDKLDEVKDVLIVVADEKGSMIGGKIDIMNSVANLVDNVYTRLDKKGKKMFKETIIEKIFDK